MILLVRDFDYVTQFDKLSIAVSHRIVTRIVCHHIIYDHTYYCLLNLFIHSNLANLFYHVLYVILNFHINKL
jgi:hypothetical protein